MSSFCINFSVLMRLTQSLMEVCRFASITFVNEYVKKIAHLTSNLYTPSACILYYIDFASASIDKAAGNFALVFKRFYASAVAKELGLNNNLSVNTCNKLSANDIINQKVWHLKFKSGIDDIPFEYHWLPNICWISKINPNKTRFVIASHKSFTVP